MSKTSAIIVLIFGIVVVGLSLWVRELKSDITDKTNVIQQLNKDNADLANTNQSLKDGIAAERKASADMAAKNAELEQKLKDRKPKYDEATKNDSCANTNAPDAVIDLMQ
ncbi:hypothetical protein [Salmonella phage SE4]|uniref:Rz-like spanin n=1 Tax=Salmonella phage SE4 TaxID=2575328 RepID=UPI0011D2E0CC|nr:Rz-like spanin [Salmonella phage SE4]QEG07758.1 hypothetical protein [Salmonella phage SE4]